MVFTLPELPYAYDALEPHIDAKTMEIHHTKHHQAYIDKLNAALEGTEHAEKTLAELLQSIDILPEEIRGAVRNHGGGHRNHSFFRKIMTPEKTAPSEAFMKVIAGSFGGMDACKKTFADAAMGVFGSGRARIIKKYDDLEIVTTPNQNNPLMNGDKAVLGIDLREHAYYLKSQNKRAEYIENFWNVINRSQVEENFNSKF